MSDVEALLPPPPEVLPEWREAAEEIRAHLCLLRGGAPFLSPADAWQLVRWLEAGVSPATIASALERAAHVRRAQRAKTPLSLVAANRHLGKPAPKGAVSPWAASGAGGVGPPLKPLVRALRAAPPAPHEAAPLGALCGALEAVTADEEGLRQALAAVRQFFEAVWSGAGDAARDQWRRAGREELGDLLALVDENLHGALIEEGARDQLRQRHPALTAATIAALLGLDGETT